MEAVILIGLQASGKTSFYKEHFFSTHVRISLDLLRTRHREQRFLALCLETRQPFVIDNTNPTVEDRSRYIGVASEAGFRVVGHYFASKVQECLQRNQARGAPVPEVGVLSTAKRLQIPSLNEGFDDLCYVRLTDNGFLVEG